jgi:hypothetical protein
MSRPAFAAFAIAIAIVLLGCSSTPPARVLTDPREIIVTAIRTTAALSYVRIHADVKVSSVGAAAGPGDFRVAMDVDIDIRHGQRAGRTATTGQAGLAENGAPGRREDVQEFINTVDASYMRTGGAARWAKTGGRNVDTGPTNAQFASIEALLSNPAVTLQLGEPAACSLGTCYRVLATAPGDVAVQAIGLGLGAPRGADVPAGMPPLTFDVLVDQATGLMSEVRFAATVQGTRNELLLVLSNPDLIVQIVAPPPGLTDNADDNTGGFGGGGVAPPEPAPTPLGVESPSP